MIVMITAITPSVKASNRPFSIRAPALIPARHYSPHPRLALRAIGSADVRFGFLPSQSGRDCRNSVAKNGIRVVWTPAIHAGVTDFYPLQRLLLLVVFHFRELGIDD